jgi:hypothetical protein
MPPLEALPAATASLEEIGRFAMLFDRTGHFRERWGERHRPNVDALWKKCVSAYRGDRSATEPADELMLCLAFDWILGPYLGVPEREKLSFLRWLLSQIRGQMSSEAALAVTGRG